MARVPESILFVCNLNRVRSPVAAALARKLYGPAVRVESCGLEPSGEIDPMAAAVMLEVGVDLMSHRAQDFADVARQSFAVLVALSPEVRGPVQASGAASGAQVEYWPTPDPTLEEGSREMRLEAYRAMRLDLEARLVDRFGPPAAWE
jgi:protein-tyrosine-phosphatase